MPADHNEEITAGEFVDKEGACCGQCSSSRPRHATLISGPQRPCPLPRPHGPRSPRPAVVKIDTGRCTDRRGGAGPGGARARPLYVRGALAAVTRLGDKLPVELQAGGSG